MQLETYSHHQEMQMKMCTNVLNQGVQELFWHLVVDLNILNVNIKEEKHQENFVSMAVENPTRPILATI